MTDNELLTLLVQRKALIVHCSRRGKGDLTLALGEHEGDVGIVSAPNDKRRQI
jgi:hypothetical protein